MRQGDDYGLLERDLECEMKHMTQFNVDGLLYEIFTEVEASWIKQNIVYRELRGMVQCSVANGFNVSKCNRELAT